MTLSNTEEYRDLKRKHQHLLHKWKHEKGPCIVCGEGEGDERDHLPPKVLFPKIRRSPITEFFTFPVCKKCNGGSSDADFLFSVLLSVRLNQESIINKQEPTDLDLLALYKQTDGHLSQNQQEAAHRIALLRPFLGIDPQTGKDAAINYNSLPINQTLTKIVKSIYWLNTGGDIMERYNPGWWICTDIDTSKKHFIESLKTSSAEFFWEDRFITRFTIVHPENKVGSPIVICSLHFYTNRCLGEGVTWLVMASPAKTVVDGKSLTSIWGAATIEPRVL